MEKAIVLCSGGMDSCVTAAIARKEYELAFLHLNYGQQTEKRELKAFKDIADYYKITQTLIIDVSFLKQIGGSSLTDKNMQINHSSVLESGIPNTYVPFRNANILAMAVSWAEVIDAKAIFIGAVEEDSSGYPDCRENFFTAFNKVISLGTKPDHKIEIKTPIIHLNKAEIVLKGLELGAPLELTWSCYSLEEYACGTCDSCKLRRKGFNKAGVKDPLNYI